VSREVVDRAAAALAGARGRLRKEGTHLGWPAPSGGG